MELTEHQINQKYAKQCMHCTWDTLSANEYEWICVANVYNVVTRKSDISKIQRKKINFINRLKYVEKRLYVYV